MTDLCVYQGNSNHIVNHECSKLLPKLVDLLKINNLQYLQCCCSCRMLIRHIAAESNRNQELSGSNPSMARSVLALQRTPTSESVTPRAKEKIKNKRQKCNTISVVCGYNGLRRNKSLMCRCCELSYLIFSKFCD